MGYHDLSSCTLTAVERREEGLRIVHMLRDSYDQMQEHERSFLERMDDLDIPVSVKQLFWLRDLKDKYL